MDVLHTSTIDLISSIHGHQRRAERAINKRDLQAAVKNGERKRQVLRLRDGTFLIRWKYTFADVVYITDESSTHEITSWIVPLPLESVKVSLHDEHQYTAAKNRIAQNPEIITSHSLLVVDHSGSMKTADVSAHRCRANAVSYAVATEFIAKRLHNPSSGVTPFHVVTVIEMQDDAEVIFEKEPISWVLYNKIVDRAKISKPRSHGNYYPSLLLAYKLLCKNDHENLALSLLFLSDGRPSDRTTSCQRITNNTIYQLTSLIGERFGKRLSFGMAGFGSPGEDFRVLKMMALRLKSEGCIGHFVEHDLRKIDSLSSSLVSMTSSLMNTSIILTKLRNGEKREERSVNFSKFQPIRGSPDSTWEIRTIAKHDVSCNELVRDTTGCFTWKKRSLLHPDATGIAYKTDPFAKGAERLVYQFSELDVNGQFIGSPLVAKDSKFYNEFDRQDLNYFHYKFCKTQKIASKLAQNFNKRLDMCKQVGSMVPRISFLQCFIYVFFDGDVEYAYLVEKQLDHLQYTKWNNNTGGVRGQTKGLLCIEEESEETITENIPDGDSEDEEENDIDCHRNLDTTFKSVDTSTDILDTEVPQAFTHFTHKWTKRSKMVCDLQGVLNPKHPAVFELTDPAIHYDSPSRRSNVFGQTDRGQKGMSEFFKTHECNNLCKALGF